MIKNKKMKSFTLIELVIVIAIFGILATTVLAALNTSRNKAKDVRIKNGVRQIRSVIENFNNSFDSYNMYSLDAGGTRRYFCLPNRLPYPSCETASVYLNPTTQDAEAKQNVNNVAKDIISQIGNPSSTWGLSIFTSASGWVAFAGLYPYDGTNFYCTDYTGKSGLCHGGGAGSIWQGPAGNYTCRGAGGAVCDPL